MLKKVLLGLFEVLLVTAVIAFIGIGAVLVYANVQATNIETDPLPEPPSGQIITVDGYQYYVDVLPATRASASPTPLLLLHDLDLRGSSMFGTFTSDLNRDYTLIVPDMLGFGYSQRVTDPGPHYTHAGQAASIVAMLDSLGITQVDVLGQGYGGAIAAQLALDYPDRIRRVAFMAATIYPRDESDYIGIAWEQVRGLPLGIGRGLSFMTYGVGLNGVDETYSGLAQIQGTSDALAALQTTLTDENAALAPRIPNITQPTAVIWSGGDDRVPVRYADRLIADTNPDEVLILNGGTHYPFIDRPAEVQETLGSFFGN